MRVCGNCWFDYNLLSTAGVMSQHKINPFEMSEGTEKRTRGNNAPMDSENNITRLGRKKIPFSLHLFPPFLSNYESREFGESCLQRQRRADVLFQLYPKIAHLLFAGCQLSGLVSFVGR